MPCDTPSKGIKRKSIKFKKHTLFNRMNMNQLIDLNQISIKVIESSITLLVFIDL